MTAPDLLPCPFCGGEASAWNLTLEGAVHCADCRATIVRQHKPVYDTGYEEAIAAWNTRATPAPAAMTPEMRALVDEVKFIRDTILKNTRDADGPHTITMPDGSVHTGPLVDLWHNINALIVRRLTDRLDALAALRAGGDG